MPRVLFDDFLFVLVVLVIVVNLSKVFVYAAYFFAGVLVLVLVLVGLTKLAAAALFGVAFLADDEDLFAAEAGAAAFAFGVGFFAERVEAALFDPPFFAFVDDTNNGLIN